MKLERQSYGHHQGFQQTPPKPDQASNPVRKLFRSDRPYRSASARSPSSPIMSKPYSTPTNATAPDYYTLAYVTGPRYPASLHASTNFSIQSLSNGRMAPSTRTYISLLLAKKPMPAYSRATRLQLCRPAARTSGMPCVPARDLAGSKH